MRIAVGIFGLVCGAIVIWTVGNYGYSSADDPAAKWNIGFLFSVIAAAGLFGHGVAIRLWRINRFWSAITFFACAAALLLNLSNSLGAIAGRNNKATAEASSKESAIRGDRTELARLQKQLDRLGAYTFTDNAAVDAARRALDAATVAKERECGNGDPRQRGKLCLAKEDAEKEAAATLTKTTAARAMTDRASRIEADMRLIQERLRLAGPIAETNTGGNVLAKLFRLPDSEAGFAGVLQNLALAAVVEIIIVLCMVSFELLGKDVAAHAPATRPDSAPAGHDATSLALLTAEKPRLVASAQKPAGSVREFFVAALEVAEGERLQLTSAYLAYAARCRENERSTVSPEVFMETVENICRQTGITLDIVGGRDVLINIRLATVSAPTLGTAPAKPRGKRRALGPLAN